MRVSQDPLAKIHWTAPAFRATFPGLWEAPGGRAADARCRRRMKREEQAVQYETFGASGLVVSRIAFGAMTFGRGDTVG